MRRWAPPLGALLGVLLLAAWVAPQLFDWTARRDQLAAIAAARIGQPVALSGPVRLTLLPRPTLEAEGVTVGEPGAPTGFVARALRLRLSGAPLLLGRLVPREVALVGASLRLPWPPAPGPAADPDWWARLSSLAVEVVDGRLALGDAVLEGVQGRFTAGAQSEALRAAGRFLWDGREVRFDASLGRPGLDPSLPLDLEVSSGAARASLRGILRGEGGLEGRIEASGPDLAALLPGPPGEFRARGRLTLSADLAVADELALDLAGGPARGAVTLRLAPEPRLEVALAAGRIDLDPWLASLRAGRGGIPFGLDLSAEAATLRGMPLRRLRAAVSREGDRLGLTDGAAILPGDTAVELDGATAGASGTAAGASGGAGGGERVELALRFRGEDLRAALAALGWPLPALPPDRLRRGEGRARLALEESRVVVSDLAAVLDGSRLSGAGVLRRGSRPALGLGLTLDTLALDGLLDGFGDAAVLGRALAGFDANLRVAADRLSLGGVVAERAALDAAVEEGRLVVRRLSGRVVGADVTASGSLLPGRDVGRDAPRAGAGGGSEAAVLRVADLMLEASAPDPRPLLRALPGAWPDGTALAAEPLTLRLSGGGPPAALALRAEAEWSGLRLEAAATADAGARRGGGTLTLRHPGATRLLAALFGPGTGTWIGDGSMSLIAAGSAGPQGVVAERFDLVAGGLRAGGALALALDGARPRLSGRVAAEGLPLPPLRWDSRAPLPFEALRAIDAELQLSALRLGPYGPPPMEEVEATLRLAEGALRAELLRGRWSGGAATGVLTLDAAGAAPRASLDARLGEAALTGPLLGIVPDLVAGTLGGQAALAAEGSSPAALLATLGGEASLLVREGALRGLDAAAALREATAAAPREASLRAALSGGDTAFAALEARLRLAGGRAVIEAARVEGEEAGLDVGGEIDLPRGTAALRLMLRAPAGAPPVPGVGLRLFGPLERPERLPDLSGWLRWRAEQGG